MSVNTNLVELLNYVSPYTIDGEHSTGMLARFKVGQSYGVNDNNLKSNGVQLAFTVNKNTHKSVNITVYEKYNGVVTVKENVRKNLNCGGHGFWVTVDGVKYATVELFDAVSLSRWAKGHINVLNTKEVDLKDFTSCDNVPNVPEVEKVEKVLDFTPVFYEIDEKMARLAREMNSFREYEENSTTEHYKARVKEVFSIAEKNQSEKSLYLANVYAKKYAEYINNSNRVDCIYPSVMICGSANFNSRKKEKQNARRQSLMNDYEKLQNLLEKIERPDGFGYAEIKRDTITANEFDGVQFFKVVTNEEVNRLQLVDFEEIPTDEHKSILKHNGFKWSPRFQAWQRQLTENAIGGVWRVVKEFERLENEEIEELHATIQENKPVEPVAEVENAEPVEPVAEVEKAEPVAVEEIPKTDLLDYVMKNFDLTERQSHDINRFYPDFIDKKEFGYIIDFLNDIYGFVSYAIKLIKTHGSYDTLDMYCRSDIVEIIFNYSTATKELYEDGTNAIFILMRDCLGSNNSRYISKCNNRLYIENDVLIDKEFSKISYDKRNDILDLIEHCEHFTTKKELLSIVSTQFNISKDIVIELYNKYMDNLYLDENIEPVEETPTVEPVEEVGLDINTSYPELQCFEDIEKVEENTVFKVGCFYTGSDKSLYLVTKRGLNTIDLMSISKDFKEYDIPIVTDIYDNEYITISYSNSISVISSIDIKYTEKNFKRTLYDFVNNNFYGNDVYGKYDVEDVKRVLNMLYGKIID